MKGNQANWGGSVDFLNLYLYTVLFLQARAVSLRPALPPSADSISECHTEFCIHQHHETVVVC